MARDIPPPPTVPQLRVVYDLALKLVAAGDIIHSVGRELLEQLDVVAERDRYRQALEDIARTTHDAGCAKLARRALDGTDP